MAIWYGQVIKLPLDVPKLTQFHKDLVYAYSLRDVHKLKLFLLQNKDVFINNEVFYPSDFENGLSIQCCQYFNGMSAYHPFDVSTCERACIVGDVLTLQFFTSVKSYGFEHFIAFLKLFIPALKCPEVGILPIAYFIDDDHLFADIVCVDKSGEIIVKRHSENYYLEDSEHSFFHFDFNITTADK